MKNKELHKALDTRDIDTTVEEFANLEAWFTEEVIARYLVQYADVLDLSKLKRIRNAVEKARGWE